MSEPPQPPPDGAPPSPDRGKQGSLRAGVITGAAVYAVAVVLGSSLSGGGQQLEGVSNWVFGMFLALALLSPVMLLAGIVATIVRGTRMFGAGLLISTSLSILVVGGVCIALANQPTR